ncbi:DNA polymerase III subunit chi, putative [Babesia ovis]|uniref:DNA polymerase III subunit chi, putative n=1 Tax=Babesia ovis TaxID=5869 RepID=A0A9W5TAQ6_BABOV|nr:DNA polymerase III subunit chi, putative [Babesia ovis]
MELNGHLEHDPLDYYDDDGLSDYLDDCELDLEPGEGSPSIFDMDTMTTRKGGIGGSLKGTNGITDQALEDMRNAYYAASFPGCSAYDSATFYLLQAEVLVGKRRYREALAAALVAEKVGGHSKVADAIKMICLYQLNDDDRFKKLKQQLVSSGLGGLSETLMKQARGTIEVSNWVPEFLNCLERMSNNKQK